MHDETLEKIKLDVMGEKIREAESRKMEEAIYDGEAFRCEECGEIFYNELLEFTDDFGLDFCKPCSEEIK